MTRGDLAVSVIVANNAAGDIDDGTVGASVRAGTFPGIPTREGYASAGSASGEGGNTVIGVVATNARLDKAQCRIVAEGAHDGLARAITPPHMRSDGDAFVAAATGLIEAPIDEVRLLAVVAVEQAVRESVGSIEG